MVVAFDPGYVFAITIKNIGETAAKNVKIEFDPVLTSTMNQPWGWEESNILSDGIDTLPPGHEIRFHFDSFTSRLNSDLPVRYAATVSYSDSDGNKMDPDRQTLDLRLYAGSAVPPKGMSELVSEMASLRKDLRKWTDGNKGLLVHALERNRMVRLRDRPTALNTFLRVLEREGTAAAISHALRRWRRRTGWYRQGPR